MSVAWLHLFQQSVVSFLGALGLGLSVSDAQLQPLQLPLQAAPAQLHPGGSGLGRVQRLPQAAPLRLQTQLGGSLLVHLVLQRQTNQSSCMMETRAAVRVTIL